MTRARRPEGRHAAAGRDAPPGRVAPHAAFAIAAPGLAPLVADELRASGATVGPFDAAGVPFLATDAVLLRANLEASIASRIIVRIGSFEARDFRVLVARSRELPWTRYIAEGTDVAVRVTAHKSRLHHTGAIAERVARALGEVVPGVRAREAKGAEDDEPAGGPPQLVLVRFDRDQCVVSIDSSGALLHRRGWRLESAKAPLRETLAAALLTVSGWSPGHVLVDPFAGSGTIAIEAARRARRMAPGIDRVFACEGWPSADQDAMAAVRESALERIRAVPAGTRILARDRDPGAIRATQANAERAQVSADVDAAIADLDALDLPAIAPGGWLVTNPPYGHRVGDTGALRALWGRLGAIVRAGGPTWRLAVVDPGPPLSRELRLRLRHVVETTNGGLPVAFAVSDISE